MALPGPSFTFGERVGLILLAQTSATSACAIVGLLSYIAYSAVCIFPGSSRRWRVGGPAEVFFLNQLGWDLVQAAGGLMNIKWAADATIQPGPYCSAQGAIKQMSDIGSAISTLIISLYMLRVLCFWRIGESTSEGRTETEEKKRKTSLNHSVVVIVCLGVVISLLVSINIAVQGVHRFYGPTGYWCWIRAEYSVQRTATDFAFMWATTGCNIAIYGILFLYFKGYITTDGWYIQLLRKPEPALGHLRLAHRILFYPLVYTLTILPLSIVRYMTFAHHRVSFAVTCFVDIVYLSSGLLNVLLFSFTRPYLLPHDPPPTPDVVSESRPHDDAIAIAMFAGASRSEGSDEESHTERHEWYGLPRTESPVDYGDSACEGSVRGSAASLSEKLGMENGSWQSLDV
ncbi:hypothetical protein BC826DRAFT_60818 [Russula brevipes]|nr:hypothetical protein BC826DRAFT_60818 [Russula brevipes]